MFGTDTVAKRAEILSVFHNTHQIMQLTLLAIKSTLAQAALQIAALV